MERVTIEVEPAPFGVKCGAGQIEITKVMPGSQAERKGVQVGWRLVEVAGKSMHSSSDIAKALLAGKKGGKKYEVVFEAIRSIKKREGGGHRVMSIARENVSSTVPVEIQEVETNISEEQVDHSEKINNAEASGKDSGKDNIKAEAIETAADQNNESLLKEQIAKQKAEEEERNRKIQEEEERKKKEEEERKKKEEEEAERKRRENGMVTLRYEMYAEQFEIKNGSTTAANIDEEYALTFVMPNCKIHLSKLEPSEIREKQGPQRYAYYIPEQPEGVYQGLEADNTYYVYIHQDSEQEKKDREAAKRMVEQLQMQAHQAEKGGRKQEGCSCIEGNPCADEYICKDWNNRFAVAKANGWKGF